MKGLIHKLIELLPPTVGHVRQRDTRLSTNKFYNFKCRTERFSNSLYAFANIILQLITYNNFYLGFLKHLHMLNYYSLDNFKLGNTNLSCNIIFVL